MSVSRDCFGMGGLKISQRRRHLNLSNRVSPSKYAKGISAMERTRANHEGGMRLMCVKDNKKASISGK